MRRRENGIQQKRNRDGRTRDRGENIEESKTYIEENEM